MDVVVVGSCNYDLFTYVKKFPRPGETLFGKSFRTGYGGKGANQAVCARILGAKVSFVGKVGRDHFGELTKSNFATLGVDTSSLFQAEEGISTGVATICVEDSGENNIIVVKGYAFVLKFQNNTNIRSANDKIEKEEVDAAMKLIKSSTIVLCQNEIPIERTVQALSAAKQLKATTIFNPAPASKDFPPELYPLVDIWCLNETELQVVTNLDEENKPENCCRALLEKSSCEAVVLTQGSKGALLLDRSGIRRISARQVDEVVDTTGAGDAFIAGLAVGYLQTKNLNESCEIAAYVAAETVKFQGCQSSYMSLKPFVLGESQK